MNGGVFKSRLVKVRPVEVRLTEDVQAVQDFAAQVGMLARRHVVLLVEVARRELFDSVRTAADLTEHRGGQIARC